MSKEDYLKRKEQKILAKEREKQKKKVKKSIKIAVIVLVIGGGVFGGGWFLVKNISLEPESGIISKNGIHWHANLNIQVMGESIDIPAGLGLERLPHKPLHTHDRDNIIHLEFLGLVRKSDLKLANFFEIWGKKFNKDCIFDECSGPDGQLKMLVNGELNSEFENYIMRDGDKIEIIFE